MSEAQARVDRALVMVRDSLTAYANAQLAARDEPVRVPPTIAFFAGALWGAMAQVEWGSAIAEDDEETED